MGQKKLLARSMRERVGSGNRAFIEPQPTSN